MFGTDIYLLAIFTRHILCIMFGIRSLASYTIYNKICTNYIHKRFILQLANTFRLGNEMLSATESNEQPTMNVMTPFDESCKMRLWKLSAYPSSVIPFMELRCPQSKGRFKYDIKNGVGGRYALSSLYCDVSDEIVPLGFEQGVDDVDTRLLVVIKCKMTYLLDEYANVSLK